MNYKHAERGMPLRRMVTPALLLGASVATWSFRQDFRGLRNQYLPGFRHSFDDYLQYVPAALTFSLKAAGVKGKYDTKRSVVAYGFSSFIMAGLVNGIKYTSRVERPDGSGRNSFPSGHTANAFMNATLLHLDYGDRSFLYSVGGYTLSAATAMGRQFNNRHWVSDVLAGAAIGILSAELGNYLAGKCFTSSASRRPGMGFDEDNKPPPGYLSFRMGYVVPSNRGNPKDFYMLPGVEIAMEGGWFLNKYLGLGVEFGFTALPVVLDTTVTGPLPPTLLQGSNKLLTTRYLRAGPVFRFPAGSGWTIGSKLLLGTLSGPKTPAVTAPWLGYSAKKAFSWNTEINIQKKIGQHFGIRTYLSYSSAPKSFTVLSTDQKNATSSLESVNFNYLSWGIGLCALF
jgi:membrane-associated phospholipid phosphatase